MPFGASEKGRNAEAFLYGLHDAMESERCLPISPRKAHEGQKAQRCSDDWIVLAHLDGIIQP